MNKSKQSKKFDTYYIYRTKRTTKNGKVLYARDYGLKAWRIPICK